VRGPEGNPPGRPVAVPTLMPGSSVDHGLPGLRVEARELIGPAIALPLKRNTFSPSVMLDGAVAFPTRRRNGPWRCHSSDGRDEFGERDGDPQCGGLVDGELVMTAADVRTKACPAATVLAPTSVVSHHSGRSRCCSRSRSCCRSARTRWSRWIPCRPARRSGGLEVERLGHQGPATGSVVTVAARAGTGMSRSMPR